jgi:hypothetical protein
MDVSNLVIAKIQEYQNINGVSGFEPEIPPLGLRRQKVHHHDGFWSVTIFSSV